MDAWLAFARSGDPSHAGIPRWPRYAPPERATLELGDPCRVRRAPDEARRRALSEGRVKLGAFVDALPSARAAAARRLPLGPRAARAGSTGSASTRRGSASTSPRPGSRCPAPDLLIAQALPRTERIKLCPGAHLLPYHHPIELAHRVAFLDQLARGRYMLGVGISALPSDLALFGVDAAGGQNRRMTLEALDIMLRLWRGEPFVVRRRVLEGAAAGERASISCGST